MTEEGREGQYDLLTAAALGLAVGAGLMLLMGGARKPKSTLERLRRKPMARAAAMAAGSAGSAGRRGAKWAARHGHDLVEALDVDALRDQMGDLVGAARETIDEAVSHEVRDLKRAIRRQRRKLGL